MEAELQRHLAQAQACIDQMQAALAEDRWDAIEPLDIQCRELIDLALDSYTDITDEEQREFRVQAGDILGSHQQLLIDTKNRLETLKTEIGQALKSDKMSRAYRDNL